MERQPDYPRAFVLPCTHGYMVALGSRYVVVQDNRILAEGSAWEQQKILHVSVYKDTVLLGTDAKLLEVKPLIGQGESKLYATSRRLMAAEQLSEDEILVADKFGCIRIASWNSLEQESITSLREAVTHMSHYPKDLLFVKDYGWMKDLAASCGVEPLPTAPVGEEVTINRDDESNKFDSGKSTEELRQIYRSEFDPGYLGHMATITALTIDRGLCISSDRDEKIRVTKLSALYEIEAILCGHAEFVVDVLLIDTECVASVGADCTLRLWSLDVPQQVGDAINLTGPPLCIRRLTATSLLIPIVGQTQCDVYDFVQHKFTQMRLPSVPLAVWVDNGRLIYVDDRKVIHLEAPHGEQGTTVVSKWLADEDVVFYNHWKHDRREGAPSVEELRAKRLRHAPKGETESQE